MRHREALALALIISAVSAPAQQTSCPAPPAPSILYAGESSGCQPPGGACVVLETIAFDLMTLGTLDACHTVVWTFSDGTQATTRSVRKIFSVAGSFTARASVSNGQQTSVSTTTFNVAGATEVPLTFNLNVSRTVIKPGEPVTIAWDVPKAFEVRISPLNQTYGPQGWVEVRPLVSTVYTLTARGAGANAARLVRIDVLGATKRRAVRH